MHQQEHGRCELFACCQTNKWWLSTVNYGRQIYSSHFSTAGRSDDTINFWWASLVVAWGYKYKQCMRTKKKNQSSNQQLQSIFHSSKYFLSSGCCNHRLYVILLSCCRVSIPSFNSVFLCVKRTLPPSPKTKQFSSKIHIQQRQIEIIISCMTCISLSHHFLIFLFHGSTFFPGTLGQTASKIWRHEFWPYSSW